MSVSARLRRDWRRAPDHPDPNEDLGYALVELEVLPTSMRGVPRTLVIPADETLFRADAFMVVDDDSVCDLDDMA